MKFYKILTILILFTSFIYAETDELTWPRELETTNYIITVYQPQLESFKDNILEGRMAISVKPKDKEMLFCAAWFKAKMSTDFDDRTAVLEKMEITKIHFPDIEDEEKISQLSAFLEKETETWDIVLSLDDLAATLGDVENLSTNTPKLNNTPPEIYYRTSPHTLVTIDGDPIIQEIENTNLEYVVNTAFFLVNEKGEKTYYINGGKFWYESNDRLNGWKETKNVPSDIKKLAEENLPEVEADSISASITEAPALMVVTKPSEVILTDGEPDYQSIEGTSLLYVKNSESEIIMDVNSQSHYVLLAGRWYYSNSLKDGDWKFQEPSQLPEDFAKIPDESDMSTVRASIPGTPEAQDALLEQSIPQTATVDRKTATVEVKYDGNPEFKIIEGTEVASAVNADKTVLKINNIYYCVDDAIWFVSDNATGPWKVSDVRPDEVDQIPASSEAHNVKYVYVYDSTPEVVYVGYYPGYCHSYVYGGVVVYGTGYRYHPWYRHYYYPRPCTWGFGVHYNPWTGWGFSMSFGYGWVGWGFHPYYRPYWGPRGYHHGYRHGYHRGYRQGARAGYRAGYRAGQRHSAKPTPYNNRNIYKNRNNGVAKTRDVNRGQNANRINSKARPSTKPNNIYTDRKGNVHQRNKDGSWSQKTNRPSTQQKPSTRESRPQQQPKASQLPSQRPNNNKSRENNIQKRNNTQQQLNRSYQNRNRGNQNYNRSRSSGASRQRSAGGGVKRR